MLQAVALLVRTMAGGLLVAYGLYKLVRPSEATTWRPRWIRPAWMRFGVRVLGAIEVGWAVAIGIGAPSALAAIAGTCALFTLLTGYGIAAVRSSGRCGCGFEGQEPLTEGWLLFRNTVVFGALAAGAAGGPQAGTLADSGATFLAGASLAPALTLLSVRFGTELRIRAARSAPAARQAPPLATPN